MNLYKISLRRLLDLCRATAQFCYIVFVFFFKLKHETPGIMSLARDNGDLVQRLQTLATGFSIDIEGFTLPSLAFEVTDSELVANRAEDFFLVYAREGAEAPATIRLSELTPLALAKSLGSSSLDIRLTS